MSLLSQQSSRHPSVEQFWLVLPSIFAPAPWQLATRGLTTFTQLEECIRWVELIGLQPCSDQRHQIKKRVTEAPQKWFLPNSSHWITSTRLAYSCPEIHILLFSLLVVKSHAAMPLQWRNSRRSRATLSAIDTTRVGTLKGTSWNSI